MAALDVLLSEQISSTEFIMIIVRDKKFGIDTDKGLFCPCHTRKEDLPLWFPYILRHQIESYEFRTPRQGRFTLVITVLK